MKSGVLRLAVAGLLPVIMYGCSGRHTPAEQAYTIPAEHLAPHIPPCDSIGLNGRWQLVNIRTRGKNEPPPRANDFIEIKDCAQITYYTGSKQTHQEAFRVNKVVEFCVDYQLVYTKNDSFTCINFLKDTVIFLECNNYETPRYFYRRVDAHAGAVQVGK